MIVTETNEFVEDIKKVNEMKEKRKEEDRRDKKKKLGNRRKKKKERKELIKQWRERKKITPSQNDFTQKGTEMVSSLYCWSPQTFILSLHDYVPHIIAP